MAVTRLNEEQAAAAEDLRSNLLLAAGAGCGKTRTLVERYVNILKHARIGPDARGAEVSDIVAITFTEKAANELRERIHGRLRSLYRDAAETDERARWKRCLMAVESAHISTIHGFCTDILREFPIQAGVDPGFAVAEESEARELAREAVDAFLFRVAGAEAVATGMLGKFGMARLSEMLQESIRRREDIARIEAEVVGAADADEVGRGIAAASREYAEERLSSDFAALDFPGPVAVLMKHRGPADDKLEVLRAEFEAAWKARAAGGSPEESCRAIAAIKKAGNPGRKANWGDDLKVVQQALSSVIKVAGGHAKVFEALDGEDWNERASEIIDFIRLHRAALDEFGALKRRRGVIDFDDELLLVRDLLQANDEITSSLGARYGFILVDEFQDTDHVQADIIDRLAERGANLFVVGDAEQSIYRFRGAEVEVFTKRLLACADDRDATSASLSLSRNYRSLAHIIECINTLFANIMPRGPDQPGRITRAPLVSERPAGLGPVEIICAKSDESLHRARQIEAHTIAERIREIVETGSPEVFGEDSLARPATYGDIAVLMRTMSSIEIHESYLEGAGIPFHTVAGRTFYRRKEVKDIVNLLRFVVDGDDTMSLVGALRSPLFAVSDDCLAEVACDGGVAAHFADWTSGKDDTGDAGAFGSAVRLVSRLRSLKNRVPVRGIIDLIFDETGYLAALAACFRGRQKVLNALKVRESAAAFDEAGGGTFEEFVRRSSRFELTEEHESEAAVEHEAQRSAVELMTIHAAKGLEFPIVIVADMGRKRLSPRQDLMIDRRRGISLPGEKERPDGYRKVMRSTADESEKAEDERIFYVAATRARDHLILSGAAKGKPGGWIAVTLDALGIDHEDPGEHHVGRVTVEYSAPDLYKSAGSPARGATLREIRDKILDGSYTPPDGACATPLIAPVGAGAGWPERLSATQLSDFARCPLRFELAHLRGLSADHVLEESRGGGLPGRFVGTVLHEVLERAEPGEGLLETLERVLESPSVEGVAPSLLGQLCRPILERFEKSRVWAELRGARSEAERGFAFMFDGCMLEGKIDRIGEGGIVDFKSDDVCADEAAEYAETHRVQMDAYALAGARILGVPPGKVSIVFLRPCVEVSWPYGAGELEEARGRVGKLLREIRKGPPYAAAASGGCRCEYEKLCEIISARRSIRV